jgi:hypothetical protein
MSIINIKATLNKECSYCKAKSGEQCFNLLHYNETGEKIYTWQWHSDRVILSSNNSNLEPIIKKKLNTIRKFHSKEYDQIIEVNVPIRFYWVNNEYDGLEFGSLDKCSRYELKLLDIIIDQLFLAQNNSNIVEYLKEHDKEKLADILKDIQAEQLKVPKEFLDAFKENTEE